MSDTHRHAWAAGFIDGDGCFSLARYGKKIAPTSRAVSISAVNNSLAPLEELQSLFGGSVRFSRKTAAGNDHWQWHLTGAPAIREAITAMLPYLVEKKEIAEIVFAYAVLVRRRGKKTIPEDELKQRQILIDYYDEMRV